MSTLNPARDSLNWEAGEPAAMPRRPQSWQAYAAIAAMILPAAALLVIGLIAGQPPADGKIESGVAVGPVDVDGDTWAESGPEVEAALTTFLETPITLTVGSESIRTSPAELGISYDFDATRQAVEDVGRGGLFAGTSERIVAHTSGYQVDPVVRADEVAFMSVVAPLADEVIVSPINAIFVENNGQIDVQPSMQGVGVDPTAAMHDLISMATAVDGQSLDLEVTIVEPDVSTAQLDSELARATSLTGNEIRLSDGGSAWSYGTSDIASFLTFNDSELAVDRALLSASLVSLSDSINQRAENSDILRQEDGMFTITDGAIERTLDIEASADAVAAAILGGQSQVDLVVAEQEPELTKESVLPLYRQLTEMVTRNVTLSWSEGALTLDRKAFSDSIYWNVSNGDIWFDHVLLAQAIQPVADAATRPPTDLRWLGGQVVTTENSLPGVRGDAAASVPGVIESAMFGNEYAELVIVPDADVNAGVAGIQISHKLGSSTTYYGDSSANRKTNIEVAAAALNGTLIPPHSMFSFNRAIGGTASLEDGYQMGYGIVSQDGEILTVPSVAGGICQVATTAFQAAFWSGVPIETRSWHMYWIPRYGSGDGGLKGLDATVDPDSGLDFEFWNPMDSWLAVSAWANGQNLTIEVWGVHQGWSVSVDQPVITNVVKAEADVVRRFDDSLNPGQEVWVEHAEDGFSAAIHRVVTDANGNVLDDRVFESYYSPARNMVLYGPTA